MKKLLPLDDYIKRELNEIVSPLNIWGTGEELGRTIDPAKREDRNALFNHWIKFGGIQHFNESFEIAV